MKIVVKLGGATMEDAALLQRAALAIKQLASEHQVAVVHGGGSALTRILNQMGKASEFIDGLRVTDAETRDFAVMVLAGHMNKKLVAALSSIGQSAMGMCGGDGMAFRARKKAPNGHDLGFVGEPDKVNPEVLHSIMKSETIPVIAPIAVGPKGETFNINGDTMAGAVACALNAERLILLTDVEGVLDQDKKLIPRLTVREARDLIANGTISGGMIPKIQTAIDAVEGGVNAAVILDGRIPHVLLLELFTEHGAGTLITAA